MFKLLSKVLGIFKSSSKSRSRHVKVTKQDMDSVKRRHYSKFKTGEWLG